MKRVIPLAIALVIALAAVGLMHPDMSIVSAKRTLARASHGLVINKRSAPTNDHHDNPKSMMHSHLSRKVFDRACAASKDTLEEIFACMANNEAMKKIIKPEEALKCHKEIFGVEFEPKDMMKHKDLICKNRDKFDEMLTCVYRTSVAGLNKAQMDQFTDGMVDVGLCIINALDGN